MARPSGQSWILGAKLSAAQGGRGPQRAQLAERPSRRLGIGERVGELQASSRPIEDTITGTH
eukprot:8442204-Alexandrium_andersonii.AAC.1